MRINIFLILILVLSCNLSYKLSKTEWTVEEVRTWAIENKQYSTWKGLILYQGSDSSYHRFIGRIHDEWRWFNIKRTTLTLNDVKPFNQSSTGQFGYYYVDPDEAFKKVKDY